MIAAVFDGCRHPFWKSPERHFAEASGEEIRAFHNRHRLASRSEALAIDDEFAADPCDFGVDRSYGVFFAVELEHTASLLCEIVNFELIDAQLEAAGIVNFPGGDTAIPFRSARLAEVYERSSFVGDLCRSWIASLKEEDLCFFGIVDQDAFAVRDVCKCDPRFWACI